MNKSSFFAALSLCLSFGLAHAQDNDYGPADADPPDRAARLSYLQGDVSLQPAGEEEWAAAIVNRPLTTGDKLWTDNGARAEIYVGPAAVRLGSNTGFSFLNVDDNTIQMRITAGVINVSVRVLDGNDQIEIDTPNTALSLLRAGTYRVEVNDAGDTTVVRVSEGVAEASGGSQDGGSESVIVHAQQVATFRGFDRLAAQFGTLGAPDEFDSWSLERERRDNVAATSRTAQYVAPDVTGYQDLDSNGSWSSEDEYGYVWTPSHVAVDWSPYRYGRWAYVGPWGWTWIDDAPWGYAPFHYGRWAHVRDRWCWVPGPRHERAVYAPALVGWVGQPGVSVSVSVGGVGWFPLGPREVYVPARRYSPRYVERVNVSNTVIINRTTITNVYNNRGDVNYRNRGVPGGVIAVSRTTFTSAQRVGGRQIHMDEREFSRSTAMAPRIEPNRDSRLGVSEAHRAPRVPPQTVIARQVIVKRNPPAASEHFVRNTNRPGAPQDRGNQDRGAPDHGGVPVRGQAGNWPNNRGNDNRDETPRPVGNRNASQTATTRSMPVPDSRDVNANEQREREERASQFRQRTDRPSRADQPQVTPRDVQQSEPQSQTTPPQRGQYAPADRQAEVRQQREQQQREQQQREQQQTREGAVRDTMIRQQQQRDAEQQRAAAGQAQDRQRQNAEREYSQRQQQQQQAERQQSERQQTERQNQERNERKPANDKPPPQRGKDRDRDPQDNK